MNRKGFAFPILLIIIGVILIVGAGVFVSTRQVTLPTLSPIPSTTPIVCTQEARQCPDGSYVSRIDKNCEFAKCPVINPPPVTACKKDSDCPSSEYSCEPIESMGTACPANNADPTCVSTNTITKGECKLKEGNQCSVDSDCTAGNLCYKNICTSPNTIIVGPQCSGLNDTSCPHDYECIQSYGSPVEYSREHPLSYFCQLKGYYRHYPYPICLAGHTLIDTLLGSVAVKDLQVGMPIWTTDKTGHRISGVVMKTSKVLVPPTHQMVHLVFNDGRELFASPGHPTTDGRTVGDFTVGDLYDGASIISAQRVSYGEGATYDVLPSGETGFYWANGVLLGSTLRL